MKPQLLDDEIGRKLAECEARGELRAARGFGRPLPEIDGWAATPDAWRMPFKILKDAGIVPPEVELMQRRAARRSELHDAEARGDAARAHALRLELSTLEQVIALRLEAVRRQGG